MKTDEEVDAVVTALVAEKGPNILESGPRVLLTIARLCKGDGDLFVRVLAKIDANTDDR